MLCDIADVSGQKRDEKTTILTKQRPFGGPEISAQEKRRTPRKYVVFSRLLTLLPTNRMLSSALDFTGQSSESARLRLLPSTAFSFLPKLHYLEPMGTLTSFLVHPQRPKHSTKRSFLRFPFPLTTNKINSEAFVKRAIVQSVPLVQHHE